MVRLKLSQQSLLARSALAFCAFALLGLVLIWQALTYPMVYDDLHLIRAFSGTEIFSALHGNYDLDNTENPGLRPLMVVYDDLRYEAFGENVVAHRLFLVGLFALYLVTICWIAAQFGLAWSWGLVAGGLFLAAKYTVSDYAWLTDGIHILQGLAFSLVVISLLPGLRNRRGGLLALSLAFWLAGLLIREDTVALLPVVILLAYVYLRIQKGRQTRLLLAYSGALIILSAGFFGYRAFVFPGAQSPHLNAAGMLYHIFFMTNLMGLTSFDWLSGLLIGGWAFVALSLLICKYVLRAILPWRIPTLWLICAILACSPGLTVIRFNLLFFPLTFIALFFSSVFSEIAKISRAWQVVVVAVVCCALAGEIYISTITSQSFQPYSTTAAQWNSDFVYGEHSTHVTIPAPRRAQVVQQLAAIGIRSAADVHGHLPQLIKQLIAENRREPGPAGVPFVPRLQAIIEP